jgi:hypothetical protein
MSNNPMTFSQGQTIINQNKQLIALLTEIRDQGKPVETGEPEIQLQPAANESLDPIQQAQEALRRHYLGF